MNKPSRARALWRLGVFAVGSWWVVGRMVLSRVGPYPRRWTLSCPYVSRWARVGARCLGIHATRIGKLPPVGALVVANHHSYADIVTIGGLFPTVFAARHDMRGWPLFGAQAAAGATIFINREDPRAAYRGVGQVTAALAAGATVVAFPEGTSTDGRGLLPFHTGIFQAAVDAGAPVVPAAIRYLTVDGAPIDDDRRDVVGWFRGEPFLGHLLGLASHRRVEAEVAFGEPLPPNSGRKALATAAEERVRAMLGLAPGARPVEFGGGVEATVGVE